MRVAVQWFLPFIGSEFPGVLLREVSVRINSGGTVIALLIGGKFRSLGCGIFYPAFGPVSVPILGV